MCDEVCLVACNVKLKEKFISFHEFVPAAQCSIFSRSYAFVVLWVFFALLLGSVLSIKEDGY